MRPALSPSKTRLAGCKACCRFVAQGQYVGAALKPVSAFLAGIARDGWEDSLQDQLYDAMSFLCKMLSNPKPRVVSVKLQWFFSQMEHGSQLRTDPQEQVGSSWIR